MRPTLLNCPINCWNKSKIQRKNVFHYDFSEANSFMSHNRQQIFEYMSRNICLNTHSEENPIFQSQGKFLRISESLKASQFLDSLSWQRKNSLGNNFQGLKYTRSAYSVQLSVHRIYLLWEALKSIKCTYIFSVCCFRCHSSQTSRTVICERLFSLLFHIKKEHLHRSLKGTVVNNSRYHFKSQREKAENIHVKPCYLTLQYKWSSGKKIKNKIIEKMMIWEHSKYQTWELTMQTSHFSFSIADMKHHSAILWKGLSGPEGRTDPNTQTNPLRDRLAPITHTARRHSQREEERMRQSREREQTERRMSWKSHEDKNTERIEKRWTEILCELI